MRAKLSLLAAAFAALAFGSIDAARGSEGLHARLDRLEAEVAAAESVHAIKRLQRAYGYYLDKGMWEDLAALFTEDAVASYPAGVFIGRESIRRHLYMNVGGGEVGRLGLGDGRLYNHMALQPVIHLGPDGTTAKGRWRVLAMLGTYGRNATWAEGVYEIEYARESGVWKIRRLDYHAGFGAPYETGWVAPEVPRAREPRKLAHPPDAERKDACEGFPKACIAPFHYGNPGTTDWARVWSTPAPQPATARRDRELRQRASELAHRVTLLEDELRIENLQRVYGYYLDRAMWDHVADLFTDDGTIELGQRGVYVGKQRIRRFLDLLGPQGLEDGWLNDHLQLQVLVTVAPDGATARARSRELAMTGVHGSHGLWSEGIYENAFVKENGVWKLKSVRYFPTFITDYDQGWAKDAKPAPAASTELPPDRPPTELYEIYPKAYVPPFHYRNPVTGGAPRYPLAGAPDRRLAAAVLEPAVRRVRIPQVEDVEAALADAERRVQRVKDVHEIENLENAYGYYLDKNLWNDLADLFARDGSMELAQRGVYRGRERVREFLLKVFGRGTEGPVEGRLGNHIKLQPVITLDEDGTTARVRSRMLQQMSFGTRASHGGAIYENELVKEDGVWKFRKVHAYNTFTASYEGGWARSANRQVPGPSSDLPPDAPPTLTFEMFPAIYDIPFHYANPVTGRTETPPVRRKESSPVTTEDTAGSRPAGMPPEIEAALREIGPRIEGQRTAALYAPLHPKEPYEGVSVTRDVAYGPHPRNVLDVFTSPDRGRDKPVVVFIHGGGFTRGAKSTPGSPFYDNVMLWAVAKGLVGVNVNYRLAPEHQFPSGIEDLEALVRWLHANIAAYGGDPRRIFLWGHSAGAAHAADYLAHMTRTGRDAGVAGAILTSGFYELDPREVSVWKAYYGDDVSRYAERSSLPGLLETPVPLLVTYAELDPESFRVEATKLIEARRKTGRSVPHVLLPAHSHLSETYAVGTADESLSGPVLDFIRTAGANAP